MASMYFAKLAYEDDAYCDEREGSSLPQATIANE